MSNVYTSYFIAIPLPEEFRSQFKKLTDEISTKYPDTPTADPTTPHITIYYLLKEATPDLSEIERTIEENITVLAGTRLSAGGLNFFGPTDYPKVLLLDVSYPNELISLNKTFTGLFKQYSAEDNDRKYQPHLTIAFANTPKSQVAFQTNREDIEAIFQQISWTFPITKVILYGVNSKIEPELQIPIKEFNF